MDDPLLLKLIFEVQSTSIKQTSKKRSLVICTWDEIIGSPNRSNDTTLCMTESIKIASTVVIEELMDDAKTRLMLFASDERLKKTQSKNVKWKNFKVLMNSKF